MRGGRTNGRFGGRGRGRNGNGRGDEQATKYRAIDYSVKPTTHPMGLDSEKNHQTLPQFWDQLFKELVSEYPRIACLIIDGTPTPLIVPIQPVAPIGGTAADKRLWEGTTLKGYMYDVERLKTEIKADMKDQAAMCGKIKQYVTALLNDRLRSHYPINANGAPIWSTTESVTAIKAMITQVHNSSKSVLPEQRLQQARANFTWIKMQDHQSLDVFALRFRQALTDWDQCLPPQTNAEKCYNFLSKLTSEYENIRADIAIGEAKNEMRRSNGQLSIEGTGYPLTLDELILQIQASKESSNKSRSSGKQAVSFTTQAGTGNGRGGRGQRGGQGRGQSGRSQNGSTSTTTTKLSSELTNKHTGIVKKWIDMTKTDNPLDYGINPCQKCKDLGLLGLHLTKFHT